jgi:hypothetical protein
MPWLACLGSIPRYGPERRKAKKMKITKTNSIEEMLLKIEKGHYILEDCAVNFCDGSKNISLEIIAKWALEEIREKEDHLKKMGKKFMDEKRKNKKD